MIDKLYESPAAALDGLRDGATVMIGGFGGAGQPAELIDALIAHGARDLVIVNNNAGNGETGLAALLKAGCVRKIPEVRVLHSVSGPFDLIAIVAATSIVELDTLIDRIGALDGVERTTSAIVLSTRIER